MRQGPAGAIQGWRRLVGAAQSIAGDGGGGGAGEVAFAPAGLALAVYIGAGETERGASLLRLGGNALPGKVGAGLPASGRRWQLAGCRGGGRAGLGRVSAQGGAKGQARWPWRAPSGPLGRGRAVDEVHRRRTGERQRSREVRVEQGLVCKFQKFRDLPVN